MGVEIMTEHTPGPWKSKNTVVFDPQGDTPEGHWQLAACQGPNGTANARLIAAAPELLGAQEHCHNVIHEHLHKPGTDLDGFMRGAEDTARAAIAKATSS